jgi:hypothetical protein
MTFKEKRRYTLSFGRERETHTAASGLSADYSKLLNKISKDSLEYCKLYNIKRSKTNLSDNTGRILSKY